MTTQLQLDGYFLSATNPTATADQRDLEALALRVIDMPVVQHAKSQMAQRWKTIVGRDITAEALMRYDELVEEFAFNYVLKAVNSDANYPKVLNHNYGPPHQWFGMKVPGSRGGGGDGPDQNYVIIPIDSQAHYELHGQRLDPTLGDVPFTLTGNFSLSMTLGSLDWQDVKFNADDSFIITLDPEPANGRPNHIQTKLEARWLFIRDCRSDWRQTPNAYRIKRLDPPTAPPLSVDQIAERAGRFMVDDVAALYWFIRTFKVLEPNVIGAPFNTGSIGGLVSQMISFARLELADDDAFVVTMESGDVPFRDIVLQDFWFRSLDYWNRTSSMNNAQGVPNADGSTTYIVSIGDPGVHNWIDPGGFHEVLLVHRWQGLKRDATSERLPKAKSRMVKLKDLDAALPADMRRVTPEQRKQQLAERLETFKLRYYVDH